MKLVIGNKRFSSWSLRPWVLMRHFEIPFEEILIPLDQPETTRQIAQYSPSGKVPILIDGSLKVWESLAICEYLNERFPDRHMWPQDLALRAQARSVANEMHGGFADMRHHLSHDLQKKLKNFDLSPAIHDIERVKKIWTACLNVSTGPFLFGKFSIADAMFAPVVNRFVSYGVPVQGLTEQYVSAMRELPAHREWIDAGESDTLKVPRYESPSPT